MSSQTRRDSKEAHSSRKDRLSGRNDPDEDIKKFVQKMKRATVEALQRDLETLLAELKATDEQVLLEPHIYETGTAKEQTEEKVRRLVKKIRLIQSEQRKRSILS